MENGNLKPAPAGHDSPFEQIRRTNSAGAEFWSSREFASVLGYSDYRNFEQVIQKARLACFNSGQRVEDHFVDVTEMIEIGKGGQRAVRTIFLSRFPLLLSPFSLLPSPLSLLPSSSGGVYWRAPAFSVSGRNPNRRGKAEMKKQKTRGASQRVLCRLRRAATQANPKELTR